MSRWFSFQEAVDFLDWLGATGTKYVVEAYTPKGMALFPGVSPLPGTLTFPTQSCAALINSKTSVNLETDFYDGFNFHLDLQPDQVGTIEYDVELHLLDIMIKNPVKSYVLHLPTWCSTLIFYNASRGAYELGSEPSIRLNYHTLDDMVTFAAIMERFVLRGDTNTPLVEIMDCLKGIDMAYVYRQLSDIIRAGKDALVVRVGKESSQRVVCLQYELRLLLPYHTQSREVQRLGLDELVALEVKKRKLLALAG